MNQQPVDYKQSDKRWANVAYNWPGGSGKTIESSGCGPTCGAMVIASIANKSLTPVDSCAWSCSHGYRVNGGTANGYFRAHLGTYGIDCKQMMSGSIVNQPNHAIHNEIKNYLKSGYWAIALMGRKSILERGTWTTGGHFILVWDFDGHWRINDPIHKSGNNKYSIGDDWTFRNEVRQYWLIDARAYNNKEDEDMTGAEIIERLSDKEAYTLLMKAQRYAGTLDEPEWCAQEGHWQRATNNHDIDGTRPQAMITRAEVVTLYGRKGLL